MGTLVVYEKETEKVVHVKSEIKGPSKYAELFKRIDARFPGQALSYKILKENLTYHAFCKKYELANGLVTEILLTEEQQIEKATAELAAFRWKKETGGYSWNGWPVHSDRDSRIAAKDEYDSATDGTRTDGAVWKFKDGVFRSLSNSQMIEMYQAGQTFVRACFACEAACLERVGSGETDIETIWGEEWAAIAS